MDLRAFSRSLEIHYMVHVVRRHTVVSGIGKIPLYIQN